MIDKQTSKTWGTAQKSFVSLDCLTGRLQTDTNLASVDATSQTWLLRATGGGKSNGISHAGGRIDIGCYEDNDTRDFKDTGWLGTVTSI